jgi:hypothetical protein
MELQPHEPIKAKWPSPVAQSSDALPLRYILVGLEFSPGEDVLGVHGAILHLRGARTIEVQETEVPLRLYRYHVAGADAENIGMFKVEREPIRPIRHTIVPTSVVQDCTSGDSSRHNAVT